MTEQYKVLYWLKNVETGFFEQKSSVVSAKGKSSHKQAANLIKRVHKNCKIVSVTYI